MTTRLHLVQEQDPLPPVQANTLGMERPPRAGIGTAIWNLVSPIFDKMWDVVLRKIRRTDAVSLEMRRSQSFSADKGNQKRGIGGKRVLHAACAWHGTAAFTAEHRSRECALTVLQQSQWRLNELGLGCVLSNFDGTNAFGATRRELLISTAQKAVKENDKMLAADSLQHGSMTLQARDGPVTRLLQALGRRWASRWRRGTSTTAATPKRTSGGSTFAPWTAPMSGQMRSTRVTHSRRVVDLSCATFMGDISRIHPDLRSRTVGRRGRVQDEQGTLVAGRVAGRRRLDP